MTKQQRSNLALGLLLILLGAILLAGQLVPGLRDWFTLYVSWPLIIIGIGGALLLMGLLTGEPDMAIPACIVGGIGGILYWQNATGRWESWSYAWALIPGFVGIGTVLMGLLSGKWKHVWEGLNTMLVSAVLFVIFGALFGGFTAFGPYWPVLLIAVGVLMLIQALFRGGRKRE